MGELIRSLLQSDGPSLLVPKDIKKPPSLILLACTKTGRKNPGNSSYFMWLEYEKLLYNKREKEKKCMRERDDMNTHVNRKECVHIHVCVKICMHM